MSEMILLIILLISSTTFAFLFYDQKKKNSIILENILNFFILQIQEEDNKTDKEKSNEDFLKFVSDSRDLAYTYIEEFQSSLNKFITDIKPEIEYFDKYGLVASAHPHYYSMKKISEAYKELQKLLPEDYGKIDT
jgi:hypothetical protein